MNFNIFISCTWPPSSFHPQGPTSTLWNSLRKRWWRHIPFPTTPSPHSFFLSVFSPFLSYSLRGPFASQPYEYHMHIYPFSPVSLTSSASQCGYRKEIDTCKEAHAIILICCKKNTKQQQKT